VSTPARRGLLRVSPEPIWPANLTLRRALALAYARPWNSHYDDANLKLMRGSSRFLRTCVDELVSLGAPSVFSPPVPEANQELWRRAGFKVFLQLALLRLDLSQAVTDPAVAVTTTTDRDRVVAVDTAAFDRFWALGPAGIDEAMSSTPRSEILAVGEPLVGFAIVGHGHTISYLQRVAVEPASQGRGFGTALVLEAARRARARANRTLFLNTQTDNEASLGIYERVGFKRMPEGLSLLQA